MALNLHTNMLIWNKFKSWLDITVMIESTFRLNPQQCLIFDFIECFTTTFLRSHSWLNWVDEDDDEHDEVGLKQCVYLFLLDSYCHTDGLWHGLWAVTWAMGCDTGDGLFFHRSDPQMDSMISIQFLRKSTLTFI